MRPETTSTPPDPLREPAHLVLGVRAEAQGFCWAVVEGSQQAPRVRGNERVEAPRSYSEAEALVWCRARLLQIIQDHGPKHVAIRYQEPTARRHDSASRQRCRVEGVLLEAAASRQLVIATGALATIAKGLGTNTTGAKAYLSAEEFRGIDLRKVPASRREAIVVAVSALPT